VTESRAAGRIDVHGAVSDRPGVHEGTKTGPGNGRRHPQASVLVVDDEPLARQMFVDLLEAHDYRVVAVARGEEAMSFISEVELVLLDAMLPGRDGWSICREIKEHDPLLPVIMVTARTAPEDVVRTFAAGADDYVAKPFHIAELTARIESRLRVRRAEVAIKRANQQLRELGGPLRAASMTRSACARKLGSPRCASAMARARAASL
jgi:DNA-binding response OmpR family regulator